MMDSVSSLNALLGRELGIRDGRSIFAWKHSDGLFWPAYDTGRKTTKIREFMVPVFGGDPELCAEEISVPVYARDRQVRNSAWYMTKLLTPLELVWGFVGKHGDPAPVNAPPREKLVEMWLARFPGSDFPAQGWRIPTDAYLPRYEGGPREPNRNDTEDFIACIREQTRLSATLRLDDMLAYEDRQQADTDRQIQDAVRDSFPAFLNPVPGKRSNFVSFPWVRKDREN